MQTLKQSQALRRRNALVEIVQPIGGVPDYAEPIKAATPAKKRQPMAERVEGAASPLILFIASSLMLIMFGLALFARLA